MKKTHCIKLHQFENHKTCTWVRSLISLSTDFFKKSKVMNGCLFLEGGNRNSLTNLCAASSLDFTFRTFTATINEIETLIKQQKHEKPLI